MRKALCMLILLLAPATACRAGEPSLKTIVYLQAVRDHCPGIAIEEGSAREAMEANGVRFDDLDRVTASARYPLLLGQWDKEFGTAIDADQSRCTKALAEFGPQGTLFSGLIRRRNPLRFAEDLELAQIAVESVSEMRLAVRYCGFGFDQSGLARYVANFGTNLNDLDSLATDKTRLDVAERTLYFENNKKEGCDYAGRWAEGEPFKTLTRP